MKNKNFIHHIIDNDNQDGKYDGRVYTRFPPEPNGYLHIGHAKAICLNFSIAEEYNGRCNLRFDDTNPIAEEKEYVESIKKDIRWLGFDWKDRIFFASDYFDDMYRYAISLINNNLAYVCDLTNEEIKDTRGTLTTFGKESPFRNRSIDENLKLFQDMKDGKFKNGEKTLRAKIDMSHSNLNMRDPVIYRILHAHHHRTGNDWCIYPMYDWAHGLEDSIERITHSLCSLEFEDHRPLYDWFLETLNVYRPQQIEFARLNLNYTVMSKRKLKKLVDDKLVESWDDPRMPTLSGMRRRGYTPASIRNFMDEIGIAKRNNIMDIAKLESILRSDLNKNSKRRMAVLNPIKVILTNYDKNKTEYLQATNNPEDESAGKRELPFSRELFIEADDFMEDPPKKYFRLSPKNEVRLKFAYFITCHKVVKNSQGEIIEIHCTYDKDSKGGKSPDGRKVRGTIHWVSVSHAIDASIKLYDRLFKSSNPESSDNFLNDLNDKSLITINNCKLEPSLLEVKNDEIFQFERIGYFIKDKTSNKSNLVFNRTVSLRDTWAKLKKQQQ